MGFAFAVVGTRKRLVLAIVVLGLCTFIHGQIRFLSIKTDGYRIEVPAVRTVTATLRVRNNGSFTLEDIHVLPEQTSRYSVEMIDNLVERCAPQQEVRLDMQIRGIFRITREYENLNVVLRTGTASVRRQVRVELLPPTWFWPIVGGVLGAGILLLFIIIFRRLNKEG